MANRTVFVIYNWDGLVPEAVSGWSKEEKAEEELLKLQSAAPESVFYVLPTELTTVDAS